MTMLEIIEQRRQEAFIREIQGIIDHYIYTTILKITVIIGVFGLTATIVVKLLN